MEAIDFLMRGACTFALKILVYGFIAIVVILFARIGYCYLVANSSATSMLPQIARYVAEDNALITDADSVSGTIIPFEVVTDILEDCNKDNAAYHYYIPTKKQFEGTGEWSDTSHDPAIKVTEKYGSSNLYSTTNCVQRGDIIEITLTVYATINSNISFGGTPFGNIEIPITKTMQVPAVKYYRGLESS